MVSDLARGSFLVMASGQLGYEIDGIITTIQKDEELEKKFEPLIQACLLSLLLLVLLRLTYGLM